MEPTVCLPVCPPVCPPWGAASKPGQPRAGSAPSRVSPSTNPLRVVLIYPPPWHIDPAIFRPVAADSSAVCTVSFAGTMNPYHAERARWRMFWDREMNIAALAPTGIGRM